ncbi:putative fibronectin type III domain-containing protein [Escherichia coli 180050]|nr:putative fibronectin type III domain-containing protein [Escherichia coli 180050]
MCYLRPQHPVVIAVADVLGFDNWTPTTSISDLLVVVMKKSTAGISIS